MVNPLLVLVFLLMCQQEVCTDLRFDYFERVMVEERVDILWNVYNVSSMLECTTLCFAESKCATFDFDEVKGSCQAFGHGVRKQIGKHGFTAYYSKRRYAGMHRTCENDKDCYGIGSLCFKGRCNCDPEFTYSISEQACVKKPVGMYQPCKNTDQCHINGSVCFKGKCMCTPGLSYHKAEQTCVRKCSTYGKTMSIYEGLSIAAHNTKKLSWGFTAKTCISNCTATTDFLCLSVEIHLIYDCLLSSYGYLDVNESDRNTGDDGWQFGTRDCAFD